MRWWTPAFSLLLAGCLEPLGGDVATDQPLGLVFDPFWSELALPFGPDHAHEEVRHHRGLSTPNFQILGYDPLMSGHYGAPAGGSLCADAQATTDGRRLAAVESRSSDVAFTLVDLTDPTRPKWMGEFVMRQTRIYDLAVVPNGRFVVLATSELRPEDAPLGAAPPPGQVEAGLAWRGACTRSEQPLYAPAAEDPVPRPGSLLLVDIRDPANPRIIDHHPLFGYGHSAFSTIIDGRTWVLATTTRYVTADKGSATRPLLTNLTAYEFYEILDTPAGARFNLLAIYKPPADQGPVPLLGPRGHDGWIAKHPKTGQTLAYLAGGNRFTILDLADPRNPRFVSRWTDDAPEREGFSAALHSVYPLAELRDGRHYTLLGPEFENHPKDHPTGILWVLDTTDPSRPIEVGGWTLPHEVEWSGEFMFSTHYFTVHQTTAFISMYHGGVWAIDLSAIGTSSFVQLPSAGVFLPDREPLQKAANPYRWAPTVEEVMSFEDGTLATFDGNSGFYAFRFDPSQPAPAPEAWPVQPVAHR